MTAYGASSVAIPPVTVIVGTAGLFGLETTVPSANTDTAWPSRCDKPLTARTQRDQVDVLAPHSVNGTTAIGVHVRDASTVNVSTVQRTTAPDGS